MTIKFQFFKILHQCRVPCLKYGAENKSLINEIYVIKSPTSDVENHIQI